MPYGTIKVDTITFTDGGIDKSVSISGLTQNPTFTGNVTVTGTVSGATVRATTISGVTISGTTTNAASGVFTTQISGAVVVAPAGLVGTPSVQVGTGATVAPGFYGAGTDQLGISTAGSSRLVVDSVGQIRVITGGSAAAPALVVGNDINTGLYSPGADQVAISTGGSGRLFVDDSGNVGIGSAPSTTTGRLLDINGFLLQPAFQLRATSATAAYTTYTLDTVNSLVTFVSSDWPIRYFINGNERLRITSAGLVGVGTSSPLTKLDVRSGVITAGSNSSTNGSEILRGYYTNTDGALAVIGTEYSSGGIVIGSAVKPSTSVTDAFLSSTTINIARGAYTIAGNIHKWYIGSLQTVPENSSVSTSEVMRIDSSGRLGIGTTSVSSKLHVLNPSGGSSTTEVSTIERDNSGYFIKLYRNAGSGNAGGLIGADSLGTYFTGGHNTNNQLYIDSNGLMQFYTNSAERARIDSSGRLLVGTSSARTFNSFAVGGAQLQVEGVTYQTSSLSLINNQNGAADGSYILLGKSRGGSNGSSTIVNTGDSLGAIWFSGADGTDLKRSAVIEALVDSTPGANDMPGRLVFSTTADGASSPTERMRIESTGRTGTYASAADGFQVSSNAAAGTTYANFVGRYNGGAPFGGTISLVIWNNGNVQNTNNSYTAISDIKLKENIVDANPQWDDIKALRVRNYNLKEGQTHKQIGLIAQEVEPISPGLVYESPDLDDEGNDLGTVTKSVNYSVLYMKAVKALQEAMERIETLEAKVAALESK